MSATALAGHGGYYDDLGNGHGSLYGYGIGGMSYGLNYDKRTTSGYSKTLISKPQIAHGGYEQGLGLGHGGLGLGHGALGHGSFGQHGLNFGGYGQDIAVPSAGFAKGYGIGQDLGHYGGDYGAGYAVGYGKAISGPISGASIALGKGGYGDLPFYGGYGNLAGHPGKAIASPTIVKEFGNAGIRHGYGGASYGSALSGAGYGIGYGYGNTRYGNAYRGVGLGHAYGGANQRFEHYSKGLTAPLTIQKNFAAYGDELGYGTGYNGPFVSRGSANYGKRFSALSLLFAADTIQGVLRGILVRVCASASERRANKCFQYFPGAGHGTPVYSGIVKAGVPVSLARKW